MRPIYLAAAIAIAAQQPSLAYGRADCRSLVDRYARAYHVPRHLAHGVIRVESNYNCRAKSKTSTAAGAGQLSAATARALGVTNVFDCRQNVAASMRYLAKAIRAAGRRGSACVAASLYNLGIGARPACTSYGRKVSRYGVRPMMIQTFPGGGRVFSSRGRPVAPLVPMDRVGRPLAAPEPLRLPAHLEVVRALPALPLIPAEAAEKVGPLVRLVAEVSGVPVDSIRSERRTVDIIKPRHVAFFLARRFTSCSLPEIGRRMGGRDHTTVLHGVQKMTALVERIGAPAEDTPEAWAAHLLA